LRFIKHYERPVYHFLSRRVRAGPDVDDLAQETFDRAIRALPRFDVSRGERVLTWLCTIAANLAKDRIKKRANGETPFDVFEEPAYLQNGKTPEHECICSEIRQALQSASSQLDTRSRKIWELADLEGSTTKEIAQELDMPEGTVKSRLSRTRELLRKLLRDYSDWVP
jgi:RNA polymerase sigma-70 factor (ECF subfamily)